MAVKARGILLGLAACLALAACGSRANDPALGLARGLLASALPGQDAAAAAPAVDPRAVLTRSMINQAATPLILVENTRFGTTSTMARVAVNGVNETWRGADDVTLTLSGEGVLRATRGFGDDLMASDIEPIRRALTTRRAGTAPRLQVRLDPALVEDRSGYQCEVGFSGAETVVIFGDARRLTRVTERCSLHPTGETFENRYWIDGTGFAWASEQYAGPRLGHFRIERLYR